MKWLLGAAAALAGAFGIAWSAYRADLQAERQRIASGSALIQTPCGPIEYAEAGSGPAVLLVHGAGGGFDQMRGFADVLAREGFRAIAMSRFGYLRTPLPQDASPAKQADAHACLLDALKIERAAILGVSAGGPSTLQFAIRHPGRTAAMVLLVPLAYAPSDAAPARMSPTVQFMLEKVVGSDLLYWSATKAAPSLVIRTVLGTPPELVALASESERARVHALMREILPVSPRQPGLLNEGVIAASLKRYELERVTAPTLVVSLPDDLYGTYAGSRYTASQIPGARFVSYPSGGHVWVGHNDELLAQILGFLGPGRAPLAVGRE
jgi:2-hydroxy-6-oxonona-2,4-dienedioate hydrolase